MGVGSIKGLLDAKLRPPSVLETLRGMLCYKAKRVDLTEVLHRVSRSAQVATPAILPRTATMIGAAGERRKSGVLL